MKVYTIGHSNHPIADFLSLVRSAGVRTLADVRSQPYSRYNPQYNKQELAELLRQASIPYVWLGHSLGGRPESDALQDDGTPDFDLIRGTDPYLMGL